MDTRPLFKRNIKRSYQEQKSWLTWLVKELVDLIGQRAGWLDWSKCWLTWLVKELVDFIGQWAQVDLIDQVIVSCIADSSYFHSIGIFFSPTFYIEVSLRYLWFLNHDIACLENMKRNLFVCIGWLKFSIKMIKILQQHGPNN